MNIFKKLKTFYKSKDAHFLYIDSENFKRYRLIIWLIIKLNKNYRWCEIYREQYKNHHKIVVFALRWYGKNVKRRTNGYAKEKVLSGEAKNCIYCDTLLTEDNATAEHVIPISQGGSNSKINLLVCCKKCNNDRGDDDFVEYLSSKKPHLKGQKIYL